MTLQLHASSLSGIALFGHEGLYHNVHYVALQSFILFLFLTDHKFRGGRVLAQSPGVDMPRSALSTAGSGRGGGTRQGDRDNKIRIRTQVVNVRLCIRTV